MGDVLLNTDETFFDQTLEDMGIENDDIVTLIEPENIEASGGTWFDKTINIKFIKLSNNYIYKNDNPEIFGY